MINLNQRLKHPHHKKKSNSKCKQRRRQFPHKTNLARASCVRLQQLSFCLMSWRTVVFIVVDHTTNKPLIWQRWWMLNQSLSSGDLCVRQRTAGRPGEPVMVSLYWSKLLLFCSWNSLLCFRYSSIMMFSVTDKGL